MENWRLKTIKVDPSIISRELNLSDMLSKLMVNRGLTKIDDAKMFLESDLKNLRNPKTMKDLVKGVEILKNGINNKKNILIVGDYDVDGVISTYIIYSALKRLSANVNYHIPDRITEGYGINESIIRNAKDNNVDIIITCDNGIAAIDQIQLAKDLGMEVIITDHHDIPFIEHENGEKEYTTPNADAIINPKQLDCEYEFKKLCGAGVIYKLVQVLYDEFGIEKEESEEFLQFAAIATVCDVVDLVDENRIIVKNGLKHLNNTNNLGLKCLIEETGLNEKEISVYSLGFVIGPCINASGRLEFAGIALELLFTNDEEKAKALSKKLNDLNTERQKLTQLGLEEAINQVSDKGMISDNKVLVVYIPDVHESIAGIIAGRIREKYNLPAIVLTKAHDGAKGSGRSIEEYNMFEELVKCKELLGKFGGHPMAAGLSIPSENIDNFRDMINSNCLLSDEDIIPKVFIDLHLPISYITFELVEELSLLEPFGKGNTKPTFGARKLKIKNAKILGKNKNVLKLTLQENNRLMEAIYFGDIETFIDRLKEKYGELEYMRVMDGKENNVLVDLVYYPEINEFRGNRKLQITISNYRF